MASIDGLGSGLDTASIVSQLMAVERLPQQRLQQARQAAESAGAVWGRIRTAMSALQALTKPLADPSALNQKFSATSSDTTVATVKAGAGATAGITEVTVERLAKALQLTTTKDLANGVTTDPSGGVLVADTVARLGGSVTVGSVTAGTGNYLIEARAGTNGAIMVTVNGESDPTAVSALLGTLGIDPATLTKPGTATVTVAAATSGMSAQAFASAVNGARGIVSAVALADSDGVTRLVLSAGTTGEESRIQVARMTGLKEMAHRNNAGAAPGTSGPNVASWSGTDALVTIGSTTVERPTNTVTDLIPGVTLDLVKQGSVTVTVASDAAGNAATVKGLVDGLNAVLKEINAGSRYDAATKKAAPLTGNGAARGLTRQLQDAVSKVSEPGVTLGSLGIKLEQAGTYAFDEAALAKTLAANPTAAAALLKKVAAAVNKVTVDSLDAEKGTVTSSRELADSRVRTLQKRVEEWDVRLAAIEKRLTRQFTSLDSALGNLRNQGNWLSGQLAGLPQMYS